MLRTGEFFVAMALDMRVSDNWGTLIWNILKSRIILILARYGTPEMPHMRAPCHRPVSPLVYPAELGVLETLLPSDFLRASWGPVASE